MGSAIGKDVPPFIMVGGNPAVPRGINAEGLKRRGFDADAIAALKKSYRMLYRSGLRLEEAQQQIARICSQPGLQILPEFLQNPSRSIVR